VIYLGYIGGWKDCDKRIDGELGIMVVVSGLDSFNSLLRTKQFLRP